MTTPNGPLRLAFVFLLSVLALPLVAAGLGLLSMAHFRRCPTRGD